MINWVRLGIAMMSGAGATSAIAQPAGVAGAPVARAEAHRVVHPGDRLTVRVPRSAAYAGGDHFVLQGVADCEIHVFVEADAGHRVRRLYWIQFEAYLPSEPER